MICIRTAGHCEAADVIQVSAVGPGRPQKATLITQNTQLRVTNKKFDEAQQTLRAALVLFESVVTADLRC